MESYFVVLNKRASTEQSSPPAHDLILLNQGKLQIETVHVQDVSEAWQLGRELHPHSIRGVVCRDGSGAVQVKRR